MKQKYLYHATYKPLLKSIFQNGLNPNYNFEHKWDISQNKIYLATDPDVAYSYAQTNDNIPDEYYDNIIILQIDVSKLKAQSIQIDSNVIGNYGDTLQYSDIIPPSAIKIYNSTPNQNIIKQSKQVGVLYHYTFMNTLLDILRDNVLVGRKNGYRYNAICFTRDAALHTKPRTIVGSSRTVRLVIDGNKLSQHYKIIPRNDTQYTKDNILKHVSGQAQQACITDKITDITKYIIRIDIDEERSINYLLVNRFITNNTVTYNRYIDKIRQYNIPIKFISIGPPPQSSIQQYNQSLIINNKIPKYLYHSTFMQNLKSILKTGLTPDNNQRKNYSLSHDGVIYLSDSISDSQYYCIIKQCGRNLSPYNIITLIIDTSNLNVQQFQQDVKHKELEQLKYSHYMYSGIIPPSAIVEIKTYVNDEKLIKQQSLKQSKQLGILYHYTKIYKLYDILKDNSLCVGGEWRYRGKQFNNASYNNSPAKTRVVCFTRNSNFHNVADLGMISARLVIDGDKLSNHYKIKPLRDVSHIGFEKKTSDQSEQTCATNIKNLNKYVIRIDIDYNFSLFAIYNRYTVNKGLTFETQYKLAKYLFDRVIRRIGNFGIPYNYVQFVKKNAIFFNQHISYRKFLEYSQNL